MPAGTVRLIGDADAAWGEVSENERHTIDTRFIGAEDIDWDIEGGDAQSSFIDRFGIERPLTRINARHVPLPRDAREFCSGALDVAAALIALAGRINNASGSGSELAADTTVNFSAGLTLAEMQALIDAKTKNLGGHTLKFSFAAALDVAFNAPMELSGFYNGTLEIDLNGVEISDLSDTGKILYLHDLFCHVSVTSSCGAPGVITSGKIRHTKSKVGILAERAPQLYVSRIDFTGTGASDSYGIKCVDADGITSICNAADDNLLVCSGNVFDLLSSWLAAHAAASTAHAELFALKSDSTHTHTLESLGAEASGTAAGTMTNHEADANAHLAQFNSKAPTDNPIFTGVPRRATGFPDLESNDETLATTRFVKGVVGALNPDANVSTHNLSSDAHQNLFSLKADKEHSHDNYAAAAHTHSGVYAVAAHTHSGVYAVANHNHDGVYAASAHTHDYAPSVHGHTPQAVGADPAGTAASLVGALGSVVKFGWNSNWLTAAASQTLTLTHNLGRQLENMIVRVFAQVIAADTATGWAVGDFFEFGYAMGHSSDASNRGCVIFQQNSNSLGATFGASGNIYVAKNGSRNTIPLANLKFKFIIYVY